MRLKSVLESLKLGKLSGSDGINNRILKELSSLLSRPRSCLFNYSMTKGTFHDIWKDGKKRMSPPCLKRTTHHLSLIAGLSLLNTIGKVIEKIVHKHMFDFFLYQQAITSLQSGFVLGDSTVNQLVDIYITFCKALDDGKEVRAIFCDVSKAFDRAWHKGLLYKLKNNGIDDTLL